MICVDSSFLDALKINGRYTGLDFNDVWLDKDAVISPDGTVYFVDLEGIEERTVDADHVIDKIELKPGREEKCLLVMISLAA